MAIRHSMLLLRLIIIFMVTIISGILIMTCTSNTGNRVNYSYDFNFKVFFCFNFTWSPFKSEQIQTLLFQSDFQFISFH